MSVLCSIAVHGIYVLQNLKEASDDDGDDAEDVKPKKKRAPAKKSAKAAAKVRVHYILS